MIFTDERFRPAPQYPVYPPYHHGDYLEDYFFRRFSQESPVVSRDYIGVSWTTLYCDEKRHGLQSFLDTIPREGKYFTVSQHDDVPVEMLPPDTICFAAGGNVQTRKTIPIPLICSRLPVEIPENLNKHILASFVGSATHPIRMTMAKACSQSKDISINMKGWAPSVNQNELEMLINVTAYSKFCLCPRGYGLNSFRIYEAMQLGSIPVIITDQFYLPWTDELNWNDFAVLISENAIPELEEILRSYSEEQIKLMRNKSKELWPTYFSMDGLYENIAKRIK